MNPRKKCTENEKIILFDEVDGLCPLCTIPLMYEKAEELNKRINLAHIYPHSPTEEEKKILAGVEQLSTDSEDIKNIIWLCPNCHEKFDKPRTLTGYNHLLNIKKELLKNRKIKEEFYSYNIEEEIKQILRILANEYIEDSLIILEYDPTVIDKKTNTTLNPLTKRKIKRHVSEFFNIIKQEFKNIDSINVSKAEQIAIQIKSFYLKALENDTNQENIYRYLVDWLHKKTNVEEEASSIIISYFIQNCEVFRDISK